MTRLIPAWTRWPQGMLAPAAATMILFAACGGSGGGSKPTVAFVVPAATPPCEAARRITPAREQGLHFKPGSPERASLIEPGIAGTPVTITGTVLSAACEPVPGAQLDFWQADDAGAYDDQGERLRGHQTTDANGRYRLETIVPGVEPGRARHISVNLRQTDGESLTTELYFAGDPTNAGDPAFDPTLAMDVQVEGGAKVAAFDFVIP